MPTRIEEIEVLKQTILELRRRYDHINNAYDQLRFKVLGLLGGEVAGVTFIFSSGGFMPDQNYGKVFYVMGIVLIVAAFSLLMSLISSVEWSLPLEVKKLKEHKKNPPDELGFLEYIRDEYLTCVRKTIDQYEIRMKRFDRTVYILVAGVIMLLVIKLGSR